MSRFTVHDLAATIDARAKSGSEASYTKKLLDRGADTEAIDMEGCTPWLRAAHRGYEVVIQLLLDKRAVRLKV